jgi:hypothetical protein
MSSPSAAPPAQLEKHTVFCGSRRPFPRVLGSSFETKFKSDPQRIIQFTCEIEFYGDELSFTTQLKAGDCTGDHANAASLIITCDNSEQPFQQTVPVIQD